MADNDKTEMTAGGSDGAPVVENFERPAMQPMDSLITMDDASASGTQAMFTDGEAMSEAAPPGDDVTEDEPLPDGDYPDMEPMESFLDQAGSADDVAVTASADAYLRLVVNVDEGVMTVVDGSVVGGRLVVQPDLTGEMVYQATVDGRRIGADAFPNLKEIHSLAPPDDPDKGHHHAELESFDFVVRIPREDVMLDDLARLRIEIFNTRETTEISQVIAPMAGETFETAAARRLLDTPAVLAQMEGVKLDTLPESAVNSIRNGLY